MWRVTIRHEIGFTYSLEFETQPTGMVLHTAMELETGAITAPRPQPFTPEQALEELCKITEEISENTDLLSTGTLSIYESWTGFDTLIGSITTEDIG